MIPDQRTTKGFGRWSDCTTALVASLNHICKQYGQVPQGDEILSLLYEFKASHLRPLQVELTKSGPLARPLNAASASQIVEPPQDDKAKGKGTELVHQRHQLLARLCVLPLATSPKNAAESVVCNMINSITGAQAINANAIGWSFISRTSVPWRTIDEKSKARAYRRMADFAVIEEALVRAYRPQLVHVKTVADLRQKLLTFARKVTGDPAWVFVDDPICSVAPTPVPPVPPVPPAPEPRRPTRAVVKRTRRHDDDDNVNPDDDGVSFVLDLSSKAFEVQIAEIARAIALFPVATVDGKTGSQMDGHVWEALRPFLEVSTK